MVQILDAPVQQTVDQLVEVLGPLDTVVPEQVIEAPKITLHDAISQRARRRRRSLAYGTLRAMRGAGSSARRVSTVGVSAPPSPARPGGIEILAGAPRE